MRKYIVFCLVLISLSGCAQLELGERNPNGREWAFLTKSYDFYEENFSKITPGCSEQFTELKILELSTQDEVFEVCQNSVLGCYKARKIDYGVTSSRKMIIVYWNDPNEISHTLYHEFTHWILDCHSNTDPEHTNRYVWDIVDSDPLKGEF